MYNPYGKGTYVRNSLLLSSIDPLVLVVVTVTLLHHLLTILFCQAGIQVFNPLSSIECPKSSVGISRLPRFQDTQKQDYKLNAINHQRYGNY